MNILKEKFIQEFNMKMVVTDLMDLVEEDVLLKYIIDEFNENFTYEELYNLFKDEIPKDNLKWLLEKMGHDFKDEFKD